LIGATSDMPRTTVAAAMVVVYQSLPPPRRIAGKFVSARISLAAKSREGEENAVPPQLQEERFFVLRDGTHPWTGPYSRSELETPSGEISLGNRDLVWSTRQGSWQPANRVFKNPTAGTPVAQTAPALGDILRRMTIGVAVIASAFWGLCWLSTAPPEVEVDPFVQFDLEEDFDVPINAIDAGEIDNAEGPSSTPDLSPEPGEDWTENSG